MKQAMENRDCDSAKYNAVVARCRSFASLLVYDAGSFY